MCYNSEKTILETLDSVYRQSYNNLDLLISDDASTDHSQEIIRNWIDNHKDRFRSIKFLVNKTNKGINYTYDRAIKACKTDWVKIIAGDDILFDVCVERNIRYVLEKRVNSVLYSQDVLFKDSIVKTKPRGKEEIAYMKRLCALSPQKQYRKLLKRDIYFSPTTFINVEAYRKSGGISKEVKNIEDTPLALMFTSAGYGLHFMDEQTVYYRQSESVSRSYGKIYNSSHIKQTYIMKNKLIYPNISRYDILYWYDEIVTRMRYFLIIRVFKNNDCKSLRMINILLQIVCISSWRKMVERIWYYLK